MYLRARGGGTHPERNIHASPRLPPHPRQRPAMPGGRPQVLRLLLLSPAPAPNAPGLPQHHRRPPLARAPGRHLRPRHPRGLGRHPDRHLQNRQRHRHQHDRPQTRPSPALWTPTRRQQRPPPQPHPRTDPRRPRAPDPTRHRTGAPPRNRPKSNHRNPRAHTSRGRSSRTPSNRACS